MFRIALAEIRIGIGFGITISEIRIGFGITFGGITIGFGITFGGIGIAYWNEFVSSIPLSLRVISMSPLSL